MLKTKEQKIVLKIKSFHPYYINVFVSRLTTEVKKIGNINLEQTFLPKKYERFTLLKSPHVDKKAREQFERVTHKRLISLSIIETGLKNNQVEKLDEIFKISQTLAIGVEVELQFSAKTNFLNN